MAALLIHRRLKKRNDPRRIGKKCGRDYDSPLALAAGLMLSVAEWLAD
jgi:hypothetical protein